MRLSPLALAALAAFASPLLAQAPPGYYASVDDSTPAAMRTTLHQVIDDHTRFPYTSGATDTWNILELAQEDPTNSSNILDVYLNASYPKAGGGNPNYDREHLWPSSLGFPNDGATNYPFTDCHQLMLCDGSYNGSRSNKPFRYCSAGCSERVTLVNNGQGGGSGVYPGNSNWTSGSFTTGTWEVWGDRRGDVARAMFYADVRYEGGMHGVTGANEPDLILTNNNTLITNSNTGNNESVAYMGMLSDLLAWHLEDPVDAFEIARNNTVFSFQGNRNPFVDHPEWVDCIFLANCTGGGDTTPPAAPTGLAASPADGRVDLTWNANSEPDLFGYNVLRSTTMGGPYTQLNGSIVGTENYQDTSAMNGTTYFYVVTAEDFSLNESAHSAEVSETPMAGAGGSGTPWINEFHYDNASTDTGEFIEVAGPAGMSLAGWQIVGYNGNGGAQYNSIALSGIFPDQGGCIGTLSFDFTGLQNGSPDGMALVDPSSVVVQFLSYEGSFTAVGGVANGMTSEDVGVSESFMTPAGHSLQLGGTGSSYGDFTWQSAQVNSRDAENTGQTFDGGCSSPAEVLIYGCGLNPAGSMSVVSGAPAIGTTLTLGLDDPTGSVPAGALPVLVRSSGAAPGFPCGQPFGVFGGVQGELLIEFTRSARITPELTGPPWTGPGNPAPVDVLIPNDVNLIGVRIFAQGMLLDLSGRRVRLRLTDAARLTIGS